MAKNLFLEDADIDILIEEIRERLKKNRGDVDIKQALKSDERTAVIYFTPEAWVKLYALVSSFSTEVQWHGLTERLSENEYEVYDIIVPPHTVGAATVTSDAEMYSQWINNLSDEEFNNLKFHGHSHVNMGVTPSSTDMKYRDDVITNCGREGFYIFMIFNKKNEWSAQIYDLENNALYDTKQIEVEVYSETMGCLSEFVANAKKVATEPPKPVVTTTKTNNKAAASKSYSNVKSSYTYPYPDVDYTYNSPNYKWWEMGE